MSDLRYELCCLPVSGPRGASSRYRLFQFLPFLTDAGLRHVVHLPAGKPLAGWRRMIASLAEQRQIDRLAECSRAVLVQKRLFPSRWVARLARQRPMAFDFDDAIFTSPTGDWSAWTRKRVESRLQCTLAHASAVIAGNRYLADYARQYARDVLVLPTVLDHHRYPARQHAAGPEVVIGWIGHSVNHPYLAGMSEVLQRIAKLFPIRVLVVSDRDLAIPGVRVENRRWSEATEVEDILCMDIGIMPMPDDAWSRGKCGFKAIQYMAAGLPVVCADVGANPDIVRHGHDGFCVRTPSEWHDALAGLCDDTGLRQRLGTSGRQHVADAFSLESAAPAFLQLVSRLCGQDPAAS